MAAETAPDWSAANRASVDPAYSKSYSPALMPLDVNCARDKPREVLFATAHDGLAAQLRDGLDRPLGEQRIGWHLPFNADECKRRTFENRPHLIDEAGIGDSGTLRLPTVVEPLRSRAQKSA